MYKCPKCGSKEIVNVYDTTLILETEYKCKSCGTWCEQYQAKLDKVLSKFEDEVPNISKSYLKWGFKINYIYEVKQFYIGTNNFSLDTVESLIKDLETL